MAERTLGQRIMDAADDYREAMTQTGRKRARAALESLVAEACAPPPERVCRWTYQDNDRYGQGCVNDENRRGYGYGYIPGVFCPDCGGRVETVKDGE